MSKDNGNTRQIEDNREALPIKRQRIDIEPGKYVKHGGKYYQITAVIDFNTIIGTEVESGRSATLRVAELSSIVATDSSPFQETDIDDITDKDWQIAEQRYSVILPLLNNRSVGKNDVEARAKEAGVSTATLYRWLKRYQTYESKSALIPQKRGWTEGKSRITPKAEAVIAEVIENYYLTLQRPTAKKAVIEVQRICHEKGIQAPGNSAIIARLNRVPEKKKMLAQGRRKQSENKFSPTPGKFPHADYPLSVVQIDHTPADIILVDDIHRLPIGRPWITMAIDVCTRMVTGYYLSFDPPSETSVAMCVAHSILPKEEWLLLHKVDAQWPVWGYPRVIHVDNGPDFRSNTFRKSCESSKIDVEFRPVKQPRYGGHIERLLGTFMSEVHDLPGTTFSSVKDKEEYDSEKHAAMTISEFEEWLVALICKIYHERLHTGIFMSPMKKWEMGVFGNQNTPGVGLPQRPADRLSVLLDFLPSYHRTIQRSGVSVDGLSYYSEDLRPWINTMDPSNKKEKRKFIFRRDPRDLSTLWFFDPELKQYFKVPFADQSLPSTSIWEFKRAREELKRQGVQNINQHQIFQTIAELRSKVEESQRKTKKARRQSQRRRIHEKGTSPATPLLQEKPESSVIDSYGSDLIEGDVDDFGDIA